MKINFRIADRWALPHILLHPYLFLKLRWKIRGIGFESHHPVRILLYGDEGLNKLGFKPQKHVHVWRTWKNGAHYIGIYVKLPMVRKLLIYSVVHEIGHVVCYETNHASHIIAPEISRKSQEALKERELVYRKALSQFFTFFPSFKKLESMCQEISIEDVLKEFYANDVMIKYTDPKQRLEDLMAEAEDLCNKLSSSIKTLRVFFTNPFTVLNTVLVSIVAESSAVRLSKQNTQVKNKLEQFQRQLDEFYRTFPVEVNELRKRLVPFFTNLNETPSSSDVIKYILSLQRCILDFYNAYAWWLHNVEGILRKVKPL